MVSPLAYVGAKQRYTPTKLPLLAPDMELSLIQQAREGSQTAYEMLIKHNIGLVAKLAARYSRRDAHLLDRMQEGLIGFVEAIKKYDPKLHTKFSTFAYRGIRMYILKGLQYEGLPSEITRISRFVIDVTKERLKFRQQFSREPTSDEIKDAISEAYALRRKKLPESYVIQVAYDASFFADPLSLDRPISDNETFLDFAAAPPTQEEDAISNQRKGLVWAGLNGSLETLEGRVISLLFGLNGHDAMSGEGVGKQIGKTREWVRRIKIDAFKKLRPVLEPLY
ncbi:MAG: sigma-70 family RNA polymerase sigma factor [Nanoarchaeota archaeon]|nr:sigma-70 family RNA polymerase sigma factor [Nanoarchaeota archaeon]